MDLFKTLRGNPQAAVESNRSTATTGVSGIQIPEASFRQDVTPAFTPQQESLIQEVVASGSFGLWTPEGVSDYSMRYHVVHPRDNHQEFRTYIHGAHIAAVTENLGVQEQKSVSKLRIEKYKAIGLQELAAICVDWKEQQIGSRSFRNSFCFVVPAHTARKLANEVSRNGTDIIVGVYQQGLPKARENRPMHRNPTAEVVWNGEKYTHPVEKIQRPVFESLISMAPLADRAALGKWLEFTINTSSDGNGRDRTLISAARILCSVLQSPEALCTDTFPAESMFQQAKEILVPLFLDNSDSFVRAISKVSDSDRKQFQIETERLQRLFEDLRSGNSLTP